MTLVKIFGNGRCGCDWCRKQNKQPVMTKVGMSKKQKKIIEQQKSTRKF